MSNNADRTAWERDAEQEAPVPYRLPPAHKTAKAGCWPILPLILLSLALLGCGIAEGVRQFAEPIDKGGCVTDCGLKGMEFSDYFYDTHTCLCLGADGSEIKLYGLGLEEQ